MTTSFADYAAQADERQSTAEDILKYTQMLCEALKHNYIDYSIRNHQRSLERGESVDYHNARITELKNGNCDYDFIFESGRKYHKVIMVIDNGPDRSASRSIHCFIDKKTGSVLKSASWNAPAKGERFNLLNEESREDILQNASWCGGYLYAK